MARKGNSDITDVELYLHYERPMAILVSTDGERKTAVWLPKKDLDWGGGELVAGRTYEITMPEQLAIDKGLV
jgi:hypothetical protein